MFHRSNRTICSGLWLVLTIGVMATVRSWASDDPAQNIANAQNEQDASAQLREELTSSLRLDRLLPGADQGPIYPGAPIDRVFDAITGWRDELKLPIGAGAWHWYHLDARGKGDGYGPPGLRGTYYWFFTATPELSLAPDTQIGAHVEYRIRDRGDGYHSFFTHTQWLYEAYGYVKKDGLGALKVGQVDKRFGLDWAYGFWPTTSNFDGYMQDPDYGLSWEKSTQFSDGLKLDSYV